MSAKLFIQKTSAEAFARKKKSIGYLTDGPTHIAQWSGERLYGPGDWVVWYAKPRASSRDPGSRASRSPGPKKSPKREARQHLKSALEVARRAEITDTGTNPAFWSHVMRDIRRALENFDG